MFDIPSRFGPMCANGHTTDMIDRMRTTRHLKILQRPALRFAAALIAALASASSPRALAEPAEMPDPRNPLVLQRLQLIKQGEQAYYDGNVDAVIALEHQMLAIEEELFGPSSYRVLETCMTMAEHYAQIDDFANARRFAARYREGMRSIDADGWQGQFGDSLARFIDKLEVVDTYERRRFWQAVVQKNEAWHESDYESAQRNSRVMAQQIGGWLGRDNSYWVYATIGIYDALIWLGETSGVERQVRNLLAECENDLGPGHPLTTCVRMSLADIMDRQGDYDAAIEFYERAVADFEAADFTVDGAYRTAVNDLAVSYYNRGDYQKSLENHLKSTGLGQWDEVPGERDHRITFDNLAGCYNELAYAAYAEFRFEEAAEMYAKAAAVYEGVYGPDDYRTFDARRNEELSREYHGMPPEQRELVEQAQALWTEMKAAYNAADYQQARDLAMQRANVLRKVHGAEHLEYAYALVNIGDYETWLGDDTSAARYYARAVTIFQRKLNADHPQLAQMQRELVIRLDKPADQELSAMEQVVKSFKAAYGEASTDYAAALVTYGNLLLDLGRTRDALSAFSESLKRYRGLYETNDEGYCDALYGAAQAEFRLDRLLRCEALFQEALTLRKELFGEEDYWYGVYANEFANVLYALEDYQQAEIYYQISADVDVARDEDQTAGAAVTLSNLADVKVRVGDLDAARELLDRSLAITRQLPETTQAHVSALFRLAALQEDKEDYEAAAELIDEATGAILTLHGPFSVEYAEALRRRGEVLHAMGRIEEARDVWDEAFELLESLESDVDDATLKKIGEYYEESNQLAWSRRNLDSLDAAVPAYELAYKFAQRAYAEDDWRLINARLDFVDNQKIVDLPAEARKRVEQADQQIERVYEYAKVGNYEEFRWLTDEILDVYRTTLGDDHRETATAYLRLGNTAREAVHFHDAYQWYEVATELRAQIVGSEHPDYAAAMLDLARAARDLQRYGESIDLLEQAVQLQSDLFGEQSREVSDTLLALSVSYCYSGDFVRALEPAKQSLSLRQRLYGEQSYEYGYVLKELAKMYYELDETDRAMAAMEEATFIITRALDSEDPNYWDAKYDAALFLSYFTAGRDTAETMLLECVEYFKQRKGALHPDVAGALEAIAGLYFHDGQYEKAESFYRDSLAIHVQTLGEDHRKSGIGYALLGQTLAAQDRLEEAAQLYERSLASREKIYAADSPELATSLSRLAKIYARIGRLDDAAQMARRCLQCNRRDLQQLSAWTSESGLESVADEGDDAYDLLLSIAVQKPDDAELAAAAVDWTLRRKGAVLDALCNARSSQRALAHEPAIALLLDKLRELQQREAEALLAANQANSDDVQDKVRAIRTQMGETRESIAARLQGRGVALDAFLDVDGAAVQQALAEDEALVEFVCWRPFDFESGDWQDNRYLALAANGRTPGWRMKQLGRIRLSNALIERLRTSTREAQEQLVYADEVQLTADFNETSRRLYEALLAPLADDLDGARRLYVAADGFLHTAPLGVLAVADDKYFIEKYDLAYLSSGRDLLRARPTSGRGTLIFANPDFDLEAVERTLTLARLNAPTPSGELLALRSAVMDGTRGLRWRPLPGAALEAEQVSTSLAGSEFGPVTTYVGAEALEDVFKIAAPPRILHVATHGFFLPPQTSGDPEPIAGRAATSVARLSQLRTQDNALLRSGIVFAGANKLDNPDMQRGADDGWLTAMEIASLDLEGVELAVLSACNTGLGDVEAGEGVVGLQRAFLHAGVQSLVTSLFEVPDRETQQLMTEFYQRLRESDSVLHAFSEAQRAIIQQRRETYGAAHPFYWGSFTLLGTPR